MKIGIMGAMEEEVAKIRDLISIEKISTIGKRTFIEGTIGEHEVVLTFSKWGKVASTMTATMLLNTYNVQTIIFTEVAGAINPSLNIGDIVVCSGAYQHDMDARPIFDRFQIPLSENIVFEIDEEHVDLAKKASTRFLSDIQNRLSMDILSKFSIFEPSVSSGLVATGDKFVSSKEEHDNIFLSYNGKDTYAVEMEGGAVAHVCNEFDVPCIIIRTISDKADHTAVVNFHEFIEEIASHYSQNIIHELLLEFK